MTSSALSVPVSADLDDTIVMSPVRRNVAMIAVLLSMLMTNIDTSIVNVALPQLAHDLAVTPADAVWVATAFLLAVSCSIPAMTGLADQIGRKRMFLIGTPAFTVASLACALSPTFGALVAGRVLQGVAAAMLFAVAIPIYRRIFPPERLGFVLGMNAMVVALGICAGPTLGGLILAQLDWPWLFLINLPIGAVATVLGIVFLPSRHPTRGGYDLAGALAAAAAIACFLLGIHQLTDTSTLWIAGTLLIGCGLLATVFALIERRAARPVLPPSLFNGRVTLAVLTAFWSFFGQGAAFVALPFLFQSAYHASPLQSALLFTPWPLIIIIVSPLSGRLADKYPGGALPVIGLTVFTVGLLALSFLGGQPPLLLVLASTGLTGLGFAIFQPPNNRDMMAATPIRHASAMAGVMNVNRTLAQSMGASAVSIALVLVGASSVSPALEAQGANNALFLAAAGSAVAVIVSIVKMRHLTTLVPESGRMKGRPVPPASLF
ncbi:MFS transporter [Cryobacterium zhongshanensis]|uniref:MFS transporter n=1 Tax=Cryobacterium zhongshanensis TaxID=2928153 RepID=A0AA41QTK0_9MICO|nr:MFS transporter [Cryobacterium zhongshanensis]MCI4657224.1 MFS transporter [Cryobacterium zhongshanensis]